MTMKPYLYNPTWSNSYPSARALSLLEMLTAGTESYVDQASAEGKITDS
jgi:hypothetical protein